MNGVVDLLRLAGLLWPKERFYDAQREMFRSVEDNDETFVPGANKTGKGRGAAAIIVTFFLSRSPCRVVTTSAKEEHLLVLWGEINELISRSAYPLDHKRGGPLVINHQDLRKLKPDGSVCPLSYVKGMVAGLSSMAAMQGHHVAKTGDGIPRTLFVSDESSSVRDEYYQMARTWANRTLVIGNTWPCENFFKRGVKGGDLPAPDGKRMYRRVIRIPAIRSPNIRYAMAEIAAGKEPSGAMVLPGVKDYAEYLKDRATLDRVSACVTLDADFWEGAETLLFPPDWLSRAEQLAERLRGKPRKAEAVGVDPGEGAANTCMTAVDHLGIVEQVSRRTPDTSVITSDAIAFWKKHGVPPERVAFDRGSGKQHADRLRSQGHNVQTVAFGEAVVPGPRRGKVGLASRIEEKEERYVYKNRRAQMYGELRELLDPANEPGFAIPVELTALRRQLAPVPLLRDGEGRLWLPPKRRGLGTPAGVKTMEELVGCSPDEADSLALAVHLLLHPVLRVKVGAG